MTKNMGTIDRTIRVIVAVAVGAAIYLGYVDGTVATVLGLLAIFFVITSTMSFCPFYVPFKISTLKK